MKREVGTCVDGSVRGDETCINGRCARSEGAGETITGEVKGEENTTTQEGEQGGLQRM